MRIVFITLSLMVVLCSCAPKAKQPHIGVWKANVPDIGPMTWGITKNNIEIASDEATHISEYAIDYTKTPIWLDFTYDGRVIKSIMEFSPEQDAFRIIGENVLNKPRPAAFEPAEDVVVFHKVQKKKAKSAR